MIYNKDLFKLKYYSVTVIVPNIEFGCGSQTYWVEPIWLKIHWNWYPCSEINPESKFSIPDVDLKLCVPLPQIHLTVSPTWTVNCWFVLTLVFCQGNS